MFITTVEDGIIEIVTDLVSADDSVDIVIIDGIRYIRETKTDKEEVQSEALRVHKNVSHPHNGCGCVACMTLRGIEDTQIAEYLKCRGE